MTKIEKAAQKYAQAYMAHVNAENTRGRAKREAARAAMQVAHGDLLVACGVVE